MEGDTLVFMQLYENEVWGYHLPWGMLQLHERFLESLYCALPDLPAADLQPQSTNKTIKGSAYHTSATSQETAPFPRSFIHAR